MTRALGDHLLKMPILPNDVVSNVPDITSTDLSTQDGFSPMLGMRNKQNSIRSGCHRSWDITKMLVVTACGKVAS